jgi:glycosyltransferase involved in cell wall biosynthesis
MNIFLPIFDLCLKEGGGQTIYQQIINTMKEHTFYYLTLDEPSTHERPSNTIAVPFNYHYAAMKPKQLPFFLYENFLRCMNMARSLIEACPGVVFDVIDTPDYSQNGIFIGHALKHHGIEYGNIVLALHGNVSTAIKYNWPSNDAARRKQLATLRVLEALQYQAVDHRYAISEKYAAEWDKKYRGLSCSIIDPLVFLDIPKEFPPIDKEAKPDIYCICRKERRKGPDIFIDLMWFLPKHLYNQAMLIGEEDSTGSGSEHILKKSAELRGMTFTNVPALKRNKVMELLQRKAINVVPSRYETLSLSALESLLHGCPTIISDRCGVVQYLKTHHPEIPFYETDLTCARDSAHTLKMIIENYDAERAKLIKAIQALPTIDKVAAMNPIYSQSKSARASAQQTLNKLFSQFLYINDNNKQNLGFTIKQAIKKRSSIRLRSLARKILGKGFTKLQKLKWFLRSSNLKKGNLETTLKMIAKHFVNDPKTMAQWYFVFTASYFKRRVNHTAPQKNMGDVKSKIRLLENLTSQRFVDRARYYYELAVLENRRNNPLISAVYKSRIMRWQGKDLYSDLDATAYTFNQHGYHAESEALLAIHSPKSTFDSQLALLNKKLAEHKNKPDMPFEFIDDRRAKKHYKVSVIVSLYKAADKFSTFMRMLDQQTAIKNDDIEIVFIDSGSPTDEYSIFKQYTGGLKDSVIYARSQNRETIQCAWNRGIKLCTGTYVTFLAADEGIHPECLEILSKELDANPTVDWVMGSAVIAEIDKQECLHGDVMPYNRTNAKHHSHILDCTYINYTPGLYRKSVHEQHGYYDETFSAAGDTEFKNRVLPFIKLKFIPNVLGAFTKKSAQPLIRAQKLKTYERGICIEHQQALRTYSKTPVKMI